MNFIYMYFIGVFDLLKATTIDKLHIKININEYLVLFLISLTNLAFLLNNRLNLMKIFLFLKL